MPFFLTQYKQYLVICGSKVCRSPGKDVTKLAGREGHKEEKSL